jgi:hypothetical protein
VIVAFKFNRYKKAVQDNGAFRLSNAISLQLIGEAVIGFGTLIFATAAYLGILNSWSIWVQSSLRLVMFFATSVTTWHLYKTLQRLDDD